MKNKKLGLRAGFPDMVIIGNNKLLFIEMKRSKKSVTTPEQKGWIQALTEAGQKAVVCRGFEEAKKIVDEL